MTHKAIHVGIVSLLRHGPGSIGSDRLSTGKNKSSCRRLPLTLASLEPVPGRGVKTI